MSGTGDGTADAVRRPTYRDVLRHREFRGLVVAQVTSELGDHIARVALASLVLARTESAFLAVLAFVVSFVPAVFGSALLGALADRLPRKVVMLGCDLARAGIVAVIALLAVDSTPVWVLLALLLVAETFYRAVRGRPPRRRPGRAARPAGVPRRHRPAAHALPGRPGGRHRGSRGGHRRGGGAGRAAARRGHVPRVVPRARVDPAVASGGGPRAGPSGAESLLGDFREGWRLVFDDPALRALVVLAWGAAVFLIAPEAVALAYAREDGAGPAVGAALMASLPAGAAVGSFLVARLDPLRQVRLIVPLAVASCAPLLLTSLAPPWQVALPLWFVAGASQGFMVPLMTTVNLVSPVGLRGRVNGLAGGRLQHVTAATFLLAGAMADLATPAVAVTVAAVIGLGAGGRRPTGPGRRGSCGGPPAGCTPAGVTAAATATTR